MNDYILKCLNIKMRNEKREIKIKSYKKLYERKNYMDLAIEIEYKLKKYYLYTNLFEEQGMRVVQQEIEEYLTSVEEGIKNSWKENRHKYLIINSLYAKYCIEDPQAATKVQIKHNISGIENIIKLVKKEHKLNNSDKNKNRKLIEYIVQNITYEEHLKFDNLPNR